jgi:hypothetical protein
MLRSTRHSSGLRCRGLAPRRWVRDLGRSANESGGLDLKYMLFSTAGRTGHGNDARIEQHDRTNQNAGSGRERFHDP